MKENGFIKIAILLIFLISFIYCNLIMYNRIVISLQTNQWNSRCMNQNYSVSETNKCMIKEQTRLDNARKFIQRNEDLSKYLSIALALTSIVLIIISIRKKLLLRWKILSVLALIFSIFIYLM